MRTASSSRPGGPDPIGRRIRSLRIARGLSLQGLSDLVGAAPSHIFHVESGAKVPSEPLAARIARALGEDEGAFRAWSRLRQRTSVSAALAAAEVLVDYMAREAGGGGEAPSPPGRGRPVPGPARLLVPLLADTADPGESTRPPGSIGTLRLDAADLGAAADLDRPFAYRAGGAGLSRVPDLAAEGAAVVLTRRVLPFEPNEVYAVRTGGGIVLARALWNGRELLLLPAPGASDFAVLPAPGAEALARLVAGRVVLARVPAPAEPARS